MHNKCNGIKQSINVIKIPSFNFTFWLTFIHGLKVSRKGEKFELNWNNISIVDAKLKDKIQGFFV